MTKLLYLIISGEDAPQRFDLAINTALNIFENKRVEDIKILFLGPSESFAAKATGSRAEAIKKLSDKRVIDSACLNFAKNIGIEENLKILGINQEPYGQRISYLLSQGYSVVTF